MVKVRVGESEMVGIEARTVVLRMKNSPKYELMKKSYRQRH